MSPLTSARRSSPPQKFLQLMGNPRHILLLSAVPPGAGAGTCPWGTAPRALLPCLPRVSGSHCGDGQSRGIAGAQCPRGDAGGGSALHHLVRGGSSTAREEEEEEEEKGLVLVLLGHHKPEARPCTHPAPSVSS